jgi:hypothetical protein
MDDLRRATRRSPLIASICAYKNHLSIARDGPFRRS